MTDPTKLSPTAARRADTIGAHVLAFFAGMIGGLAFCQLPGGGFIGVLLGYASGLPLFLSGLTGGRTVSVTACLCAVLAVFLQLGGPAAAIFAVLFGMPIMVLTRVALIRFGTDDAPRYTKAELRFINPSAILLTALALGTLLLSIAATWLALYGPGISAATSELVTSYQGILQQSAPTLPADKIEQSLQLLRTAIPSMLLMSWFFVILLVGMLAQYLAVELKQNLRPTPKLKELLLPLWLAGLFAVCLAGSVFATPDLAMVLGAFATLYGVGFVLSGMAEMHRRIDAYVVTNSWSANKRLALYIVIYAAAFVLQVPIFFMLLIGLIAPFTFWRHKSRTVTSDGNPN